MKSRYLLIIALFYLVLKTGTASGQGCAPPSSNDGVTIWGFLQPQIETRYLNTGVDNSFTFNRARIGVTGFIPYDIMYYAVIETSPFSRGENPFLLDAFISYQRFSYAKISVGQFKSPFTLEMSTACNALNSIYRTDAVVNLVSPDRDMGVMVSGSVLEDVFSYSLALTNGTGRGVADNNRGKTFHSRLVFAPKQFIKLGGGIQYGTHPTVVEDSSEEDQRFRWAADVQLKHRNFDLIGEYIHATDKGSYVVGGGCGGTPTIVEGDLKRSGYYVTGMYRTPWNLQPLVRYQNWNTDLDTQNRAEHTMVFGLNYWLNDWTRIQVNYLYKAEERMEIKNDEFLIQVQVTF
jgi:phosphate-selective porin